MINILLSALTVALAVMAAFLRRGFVDGTRAGDLEGYLLVGAIVFALAAVAALEPRLRRR